jgi:hypothetical protein
MIAIALIVLLFTILVAGFILPWYAGGEIGRPKGRAGWAWGLFLGWLGVAVVYMLPPTDG